MPARGRQHAGPREHCQVTTPCSVSTLRGERGISRARGLWVPTLRQGHEEPRKHGELVPQLWELHSLPSPAGYPHWGRAMRVYDKRVSCSPSPHRKTFLEKQSCPLRHRRLGMSPRPLALSRVVPLGLVNVPLGPQGGSLNQPFQNACSEQGVNTVL